MLRAFILILACCAVGVAIGFASRQEPAWALSMGALAGAVALRADAARELRSLAFGPIEAMAGLGAATRAVRAALSPLSALHPGLVRVRVDSGETGVGGDDAVVLARSADWILLHVLDERIAGAPLGQPHKGGFAP